LRITILSDNTAVGRGVRGEHGLAFWIEMDAHRVLFDTGQGLVLADNAHALGVDLGSMEAVVLSHGHYDHTGGWAQVLRAAAGSVTVYAHPEVLAPKFKRDEGGIRDVGMPAAFREMLMAGRIPRVWSRTPVEIVPRLWTTGEIPRRHSEEAITESFLTEREGEQRPDPLLDDQAMFIETDRGPVVLLGCAHAGVINTLDHIRSLLSETPIHAVIGGMHLGSAAPERLDWTIRELRRFTIGRLVPLHCTGQKAHAALGTAFPDTCGGGGAGCIFEF